jgi:hypothetical protein
MRSPRPKNVSQFCRLLEHPRIAVTESVTGLRAIDDGVVQAPLASTDFIAQLTSH